MNRPPDLRNIRATREQLGLTPEELACVLRVSPRTILRWEAERTRPHPIYLFRLRTMLDEKGIRS